MKFGSSSEQLGQGQLLLGGTAATDAQAAQPASNVADLDEHGRKRAARGKAAGLRGRTQRSHVVARGVDGSPAR
jgi:hypothetical protein